MLCSTADNKSVGSVVKQAIATKGGVSKRSRNVIHWLAFLFENSLKVAFTDQCCGFAVDPEIRIDPEWRLRASPGPANGGLKLKLCRKSGRWKFPGESNLPSNRDSGIVANVRRIRPRRDRREFLARADNSRKNFVTKASETCAADGGAPSVPPTERRNSQSELIKDGFSEKLECLGSTDTDVLVLATRSTTIVLQTRRSPVTVKIRKHLGGKCFPSRVQRGSFNGMHQDGRAFRQGPSGSHPEDLENKHLARAPLPTLLRKNRMAVASSPREISKRPCRILGLVCWPGRSLCD